MSQVDVKDGELDADAPAPRAFVNPLTGAPLNMSALSGASSMGTGKSTQGSSVEQSSLNDTEDLVDTNDTEDSPSFKYDQTMRRGRRGGVAGPDAEKRINALVDAIQNANKKFLDSKNADSFKHIYESNGTNSLRTSTDTNRNTPSGWNKNVSFQIPSGLESQLRSMADEDGEGTEDLTEGQEDSIEEHVPSFKNQKKFSSALVGGSSGSSENPDESSTDEIDADAEGVATSSSGAAREKRLDAYADAKVEAVLERLGLGLSSTASPSEDKDLKETVDGNTLAFLKSLGVKDEELLQKLINEELLKDLKEEKADTQGVEDEIRIQKAANEELLAEILA